MALVSNHISVTELTTLEEWDAISSLWDDLVVRCPEASVFNSYAYLRSLYTRLLSRRPCRLAILLLRDEKGELIGAAPMMRSKRWMTGFPVRIISLIYHQVITDRIQFLLPDRKDEQLQAIFTYLQDSRNKWDVLVLQEQVIDAEYESIINSVFKDSYTYHQDKILPNIGPYLKMNFGSGGWEEYLLTRSKKHRKNWRYLQNRLSREGEVTVTRHTGDEDIVSLLKEYQKLEQKSRKVGGPSTISTEINDFFQELASALRPKGNMHFAFLRLDGIPIAGVIGMSFHDRYAGLQTIFDENYADYSPGFLVCGYDIKWAMESGYSEFDFMSGFLTNKLPWTDSQRRHQVLRIFKKGAFSGLFYLSKFRIVPILRQIWEKRRLYKEKNIPDYQTSVPNKNISDNLSCQQADYNDKLEFSTNSSSNRNSK